MSAPAAYFRSCAYSLIHFPGFVNRRRVPNAALSCRFRPSGGFRTFGRFPAENAGDERGRKPVFSAGGRADDGKIYCRAQCAHRHVPYRVDQTDVEIAVYRQRAAVAVIYDRFRYAVHLDELAVRAGQQIGSEAVHDGVLLHIEAEQAGARELEQLPYHGDRQAEKESEQQADGEHAAALRLADKQFRNREPYAREHEAGYAVQQRVEERDYREQVVARAEYAARGHEIYHGGKH